ncbi:hypothetical protein PN416_16060 [Halorubrum ezzemoulense]|uniref:hypothetical protein n=1 Tax=Halorubrum ezzemoulense TaxID=337243 RepID=UPI00232F2F81|nr:hypothetical protein [Halorubrum ezzemoulense]MDB9281583.1 hypothetical protein [Halorubrum ezzemoulense]MDB9284917.1 hypothetical protein [Halorubrum ezzemoulense]
MPALHLKSGGEVKGDRITIKENGWAFLHKGRELEGGYPPSQIEKVEVDDDVYTDSYLHEEEYTETREARRDEPGESVMERKPVHKIELEYHVE